MSHLLKPLKLEIINKILESEDALLLSTIAKMLALNQPIQKTVPLFSQKPESKGDPTNGDIQSIQDSINEVFDPTK